MGGLIVTCGIIDSIGRRPTMLVSYFLGLTAFLVLTLRAHTVLTVGCVWQVVGLVQGMMWPAVGVYIAEVFPTRLRGTGNGFANMFGRLGNALAPLLAGYLLDHSVNW